MKKRIFKTGLYALTALLGVSALTSCNNNSEEGAGEDLSVINLDELKSEETTKVTFWHSFGDKIEGVLEELVEGFETDMTAKGYNIDIELINKGGGYDGLRSQVNMGTSSNTIPTMILGYPDHFADYISNDILLPLDDYVYSTNPDIALEGVTKESNDFIESYWNETQMIIDGEKKTAAIPFNKSTEIMYYNASMIDPILKTLEIGEDVNGDRVWKNPTWDQVFEVSKYIQDNKSTLKYTYNGAEYKVDSKMNYPVIVDSEANFFITTSRQWGGEGTYTVLNDDASGTVVAKNASNKAAQEYFLSKAGIGSNSQKLFQFPTKENVGYGSALVTANRAFISIGSTAGIKNNASANYKLKATAIPQKEYGANAHNAVIQQGTNVAILSKNSNNKTRLAAWMLIKYLTNTENTEFFSKNTGYLPVRESALNSETFKSLLADEDNIYNGDVAKAINAAFSQKEYFYTDPAFIGSSVVRDKAAVLIQDMYCFDKSYDTAMDTFYSTLERFRIKTR